MLNKIAPWACGVALMLGAGPAVTLDMGTPTGFQDRARPADYAAREARARRLVESLDIQKGVQTLLASMPELMGVYAADMPAAERAEFNAFMKDVMAEILPWYLETFMEETVVIYATIFTVEELDHMLAFYDTPLGRRINEKSLRLGVDLAIVNERLMPEVLRRMANAMCSRLKCDPDDLLAEML